MTRCNFRKKLRKLNNTKANKNLLGSEKRGSQKNAMHLFLIRILFRCDVSNILRYVSFVFAKESVECSFFSFNGTHFYDPSNLFFCSLFTNRLLLLGCTVRLHQEHNHSPCIKHRIPAQRGGMTCLRSHSRWLKQKALV